jgi:hypothetical protein
MGHHPQHIARLADNSGDIIGRTVGIALGGYITLGVTIPEHNLIVIFQFFDICLEIVKIAILVRDGDLKHIADFAVPGKWSVVPLDPDIYIAA